MSHGLSIGSNLNIKNFSNGLEVWSPNFYQNFSLFICDKGWSVVSYAQGDRWSI